MEQEFLAVALPEMAGIYFNAFLLFVACIAGYLIYRSNTPFKLELFFLSFFLLGGNIHDKLTFALPGVSFFEIQPDRFLFLLFSFFLFRQLLFPRKDVALSFGWNVPWFKILFYLYAILVISSQIYHVNQIGAPELITNAVYAFNALLIMYCVRIMASKETLRIIGTSLIIGAIITSLVALVQFTVDPMFLRTGDQRIAFGSTIRSNGIFSNEYLHAYYLIITISWVLVTFRNGWQKNALYLLFSLGVICSFQRMSWLILSLVSVIYFTQIERVAWSKLILTGLTGVALAIVVFLSFRYEIMNSTLVRQRLSEPVNSRAGYYTTAINNVGKKPMFGFGGKKNETYYYSMLRITHDRDRATGVTGDFHSGYFSTMFFYGLPAFLAFVGFIVAAIFYFGGMIKSSLIFAIPFLVALLFGVGNLTNTFLFPEYLTLLFAMHMGIGQKLREWYIATNGQHQLLHSSTRTLLWDSSKGSKPN